MWNTRKIVCMENRYRCKINDTNISVRPIFLLSTNSSLFSLNASAITLIKNHFPFESKIPTAASAAVGTSKSSASTIQHPTTNSLRIPLPQQKQIDNDNSYINCFKAGRSKKDTPLGSISSSMWIQGLKTQEMEREGFSSCVIPWSFVHNLQQHTQK